MEEDKKKASEEEIDELEDIDEDLFEDDEDFDEEGEDTWEKLRNWVQDNLRVILSVLIVALIAVGIYNYSKKPVEEDTISQVDEIVSEQEEITVADQDAPEEEIKVEDTQEEETVVVEEPAEEVQEVETPEVEEVTPVTPEPTVVTEETSTGKTYKVEAAQGDGTTHLARKALKDYLASMPDSELTKEHKIYIEDYMRRQVQAGRLGVGETREFSESLIQQAIAQSKTLSERDLQHLKIYSARVSNL